MSIKEIVTKVLSSDVARKIIRSDLFCGEFRQDEEAYDSVNDSAFKQELAEAGLIVEYVEQFGGEGHGDDYWSVYKFTKNDESCYVKFDGYYASYNGSDYDEWFFVEPKEVMKIDWVQVN
jgi:hypothetical protein